MASSSDSWAAAAASETDDVAPLRSSLKSEATASSINSSDVGSFRLEDSQERVDQPPSARPRADVTGQRETHRGSLMDIHRARERHTQVAGDASEGGRGRKSQVQRHPSTVSIGDKGRFKMLTFKVRWKRNAFAWTTSYLGVGRQNNDSAMLLLEAAEQTVLSRDVAEVHDVVRMHRPRRLKFKVHKQPPLRVDTGPISAPAKHGGKLVAFVLEFETDAECNEAYAALTANRARSAPETAKLQLVTWNMGNAVPVEAQLRQLVATPADIFVVGVQEGTYRAPAGSTSSTDHLFGLLEKVVSRDGVRPISTVGSCSMGSIHLTVLCSSDIRPYISSVESHFEPTGVGGVGRNKGGVAVSFWLCNSPLCFVNSHLAAHQGEVAARNLDVAEIHRKLRIGKEMPSGRMDLAQRFQHIFWMGDLNYRIDLERQQVLGHVSRCEWDRLLLADQLKLQQGTGAALSGFREGPIRFAPTFKHVPGAEAEPGAPHRPYESKKMRVPSWCDRVLWRSWPGCEKRVALQEYDACVACTTSDHTPVSALFSLDISVPWIRRGALLGVVDLVMYDLRAEGLKRADINGLADPYVRVCADFQVEPSISTVKYKSLAPSWEGEELRLSVPHYRCWRSYIEEAHLFVEILDSDKYTKDDIMGACVLSCEGIFNPDDDERNSQPRPSARRTSSLTGMPPSARGSPKPSARGSPKASMRSGDGVARADGVSFRLPLTVDGRPAGVLSGKLRADIQLEHNLEKTYLYGLFQLTGAQRGVTRRDSTSTAGGILPHVTSKAHTEGRGHSSVMGRTITEHGNRLKHKLVHSSEGYPSLARGALRVVENNARSLLGFKNRNDDYPRDRGNKEIRV